MARAHVHLLPRLRPGSRALLKGLARLSALCSLLSALSYPLLHSATLPCSPLPSLTLSLRFYPRASLESRTGLSDPVGWV